MRLIDADALDKEMYHKSFEVDDGRNVWNSGLWIRYKIYEEAVRDAPTVDAVPVIRCKDCKFSSPNMVYGCRLERYSVHDKEERLYSDDYCSMAERKEE